MRSAPLGACAALMLACSAAARSDVAVHAAIDAPPGNLAVTYDGRVFMTLHPFFAPRERFVELRGGAVHPVGIAELDVALGVAAAGELLWLLDLGLNTKRPQVVVWHSNERRVVRTLSIPPEVLAPRSLLVDLALDIAGDRVVIADPASGPDAALILLRPSDGTARRVLQGHAAVVPEPDAELVVDGRALPARVGVNPMALDATRSLLYFGPMHARSLYRVRMNDLFDASLTPEALAAKVERYSDKPVCDGLALAPDGTIYTATPGETALYAIGPDRTLRRVLEDPRLVWANSFVLTPERRLLVSAAQLQRSPRLNEGEARARLPFHVLSIALGQAR